MIHSGNIITVMGIGLILMPAITIIALAFWMAYREERKLRKARATHRRIATHYQRLQGRLLLASGSVTRGDSK